MDQEIIDNILAGDTDAVIAFYKKYSPKILNFLINRLPNKEDAQEVNNDIFLQAVDSLATLRSHSHLKTWLYKIARNKIADYYRKKRVKSFLLSQIPYLQLFADEISQPEFILEKNKLRDKIESTLVCLSSKYQQILRLHYEDNLPVKKIALLLNLTPKAAESRLFRARQTFIKKYERA